MFENKKFVKVYSGELRKIANYWKGGLKEESLFLFNNYLIDLMKFKDNNIDLCKETRTKLAKELTLSERQINARIKQLEKNGILIRYGARNKKLCTVTVATMQTYKNKFEPRSYSQNYSSPTIRNLRLLIKKRKKSDN